MFIGGRANVRLWPITAVTALEDAINNARAPLNPKSGRLHFHRRELAVVAGRARWIRLYTARKPDPAALIL